MTTDLDSTRSATVDHTYHWQPMATCPKGSKVQLLTRYGCAIYGTWTGKRRSTTDGRRCRRGRNWRPSHET